jgi:hypothetical protein
MRPATWICTLSVLLTTCFHTSRADEPPRNNGPLDDPASFPLAVWLQSPDRAQAYHDIGINTYVALWQGPTAEKLDTLDHAGMRLICEPSASALAFKKRPTIVAWMHGDEPDNAQPSPDQKGYGPPITPQAIRAEYERIRKADPSRPVMLNLGQGVAWDGWYGRGTRTNHPEDYREYARGGDILSFDIYPASHDHEEIAGKLWYVPFGVDRLREWSGAGKPVWTCIETTRISNLKREPSVDEVRSEVWMALIHGARGLIYFCHQFQPEFIEAGLLARPEMARAVRQINRQVLELAPALHSPDVSGATVASSDPKVPIDFVYKRQGPTAYVFAVAMRPGATTAQFTVPDPAHTSVEVLGEGRTIPVTRGAWSDRFDTPYQVHLYRLTASP